MTWLTSDVAELYSRLSQNWDTKSANLKLISGCSNRLRILLHEFAADHCERLLDFGCGTGKVYVDLLKQQRRPKHVTMIDASEGMCSVARTKITPSLPAVVLQGDEFSEDLVKHGPYNVITLLQVLHHIPHPADTLSHLGKLMADDSTLIALVPGPKYKSEIFPFVENDTNDAVGRKTIEAWEQIFVDSGLSVTSVFDDRFMVKHQGREGFVEFIVAIGLAGKMSSYKQYIFDGNHGEMLPDNIPHNILGQHLTFVCNKTRRLKDVE